MRIICLGNNTENSNTLTQEYSLKHNVVYKGLVSDLDNIFDVDKIDNGCYQTTIVDLSRNRINEVLNYFDKIVLLDQSIESYNHPNEFLETIRLLSNYNNVIYQNSNFKRIQYWEELVTANKSFCIFPFIEYLTYSGYTSVCCRSNMPVAHKNCDFYSDPNYITIRNNLINGIKIPNCDHCYELENNNIISARILETVEWTNRLGIDSISELSDIKSPAYYEVRPSNKCNLQCRMCSPKFSHLIENEYNKIGLEEQVVDEYDDFDVIDFSNLEKLYVAGGEPLIQRELYSFMNKCINNNKTDFEFVINTNCTSISNKFKNISAYFSNLQFIVSIDGFDQLNHYIRWETNWTKLVENIDYIFYNRIKLSFSVTVSIYNIASLDTLVRFLEERYPNSHIHLQLVYSKDNILSAYNHPDRNLVVTSLNNLKECLVYENPESHSLIENLLTTYNKSNYNRTLLDAFYKFNDKLDHSRKVKLKDYIPELEKFRNLT